MDVFADLGQDRFTLWGTDKKFFTELPDLQGGKL